MFSIGRKLSLSFSLVIVLTIILGVVSFTVIRNNNNNIMEFDSITIAEEHIGNLRFQADYVIHQVHHYVENFIDSASTLLLYNQAKSSFNNSSKTISGLNFGNYENSIENRLREINDWFNSLIIACEANKGIFTRYDNYTTSLNLVNQTLPLALSLLTSFKENELDPTALEAADRCAFQLVYLVNLMYLYTSSIETTSSRTETKALYQTAAENFLTSQASMLDNTTQGTTGQTMANQALIYYTTLNNAINDSETGLFANFDGFRAGFEAVHSTFPSLISGMNDLDEKIQQIATEIIGNSQIEGAVGLSMIVLILVAEIIIGAVTGFLVTRSLSSPITKLVKANQKIAEGDLTQNIKIAQRRDEFGLLGAAFEKMTGFLKPAIAKLAETVDHLSNSAQEMASASEEVNASSEEISSITQQMSRGAQQQTTQIINTVQHTDTLKAAFEEQVKAIYQATTLIESINSQINMLALNASIEAARAGEYGRGFAVVADNIRRLAEESKNAESTIQKIIKELRDVMGREIQLIHDDVQTVSAVSEETASGAEEVSAATEEQAATMQEMSASAQELARLASELNKIVNNFKL